MAPLDEGSTLLLDTTELDASWLVVVVDEGAGTVLELTGATVLLLVTT